MKILAILLCLAVLFAVLSASVAEASMTAVSAAAPDTVKPGEFFNVVIRLTGDGTRLAGVQFNPYYNSNAVMLVAKTCSADWLIPREIAAYGKPSDAVDAVTFTLRFRVDSAAAGDIDVSFGNVLGAAPDSSTFPAAIPAIKVKLELPDPIDWPGDTMPGDANADSSVDIMDLVAIIDYIVSEIEPKSLANADANSDKAVDIMDLVWIIDYIVGGR